MNYRGYLMQMAQRGKVIKTGGTLIILNKQPYTKRSFSGSSGVYSGGTIKKLILDRLDNFCCQIWRLIFWFYSLSFILCSILSFLISHNDKKPQTGADEINQFYASMLC